VINNQNARESNTKKGRQEGSPKRNCYSRNNRSQLASAGVPKGKSVHGNRVSSEPRTLAGGGGEQNKPKVNRRNKESQALLFREGR